jgi:hypothetical protein
LHSRIPTRLNFPATFFYYKEASLYPLPMNYSLTLAREFSAFKNQVKSIAEKRQGKPGKFYESK